MQNRKNQDQKVVSPVLNRLAKWAIFVLNRVGVRRPRRHSSTQTSHHIRESVFRKRREIFACGIGNPGLWNREDSLRNPESRLRLESGIQISLIKNPESSAWNPESTLWNPESKTVLVYLTWGVCFLDKKKLFFTFQIKYVKFSSQLLFLRLLSDRARQTITYHCKNSIAWYDEQLKDVSKSIKIKTANGVIIHSSSSNKFKPRIITDDCRVSRKMWTRRVLQSRIFHFLQHLNGLTGK